MAGCHPRAFVAPLALRLHKVDWKLRFVASFQQVPQDASELSPSSQVLVDAAPTVAEDFAPALPSAAGAVASPLPTAGASPQPALPGPCEVSEAESEDLGSPEECELLAAGGGHVLHLNIALPGGDPRPACGSFAKLWRTVREPGPAFKFCRHPACSKATWLG